MSQNAGGRSIDDFTVRARVRDRTGELAAGGDLDMSAAFRLESEFEGLVAPGHLRTVVLDLADVSFVDSAGLGALLSIRERAAQLRIELQIARPSAPVRQILDNTGTTSVFAG